VVTSLAGFETGWSKGEALAGFDRSGSAPLVVSVEGTLPASVADFTDSVRIPGQGDRDSEVIPIRIPKLI